MKKLLASALVLALTSTAAQADLVYSSVAQPLNARYTLDVYKEINQQLQPTNSRTISRSDASQRLCWSVVSDTAAFGQTAKVKEIFFSPAGSNFNDGKAIIQSSLDGTRHTVNSIVNSVAQSAVERCWRFDPKDAVGDYTITVEVDGILYSQDKFTVTP